MAQEESILGCSYSGGGGAAPGGGGGSRSKKIKQKKVPQRGLGVAQLEMIRIEEQHKRESFQAVNILDPNSNLSFENGPVLPLPVVSQRSSNQFYLPSSSSMIVGPSFSFHPASSSSKSDELALYSNGYTDQMDPRSKCIRGFPADDGRLTGDFLTLAPPSVASPLTIAKNKHFPSLEYEKRQMHQPGSSRLLPVKNQTSSDASNGNGGTIDLNLKL